MLCLLSRASVIWNQFAWFAEYVLLCFVWSLVCHPPPLQPHGAQQPLSLGQCALSFLSPFFITRQDWAVMSV